MIPRREHRELPDDLAWIITRKHGRLTVYLADDIPANSHLEQEYVRQAVRAWWHNHPLPAVLPPIIAGGGWLASRLLRREVAAGTAAAAIAAGGIVYAATQLDDHPTAPHHPPTASAPRTPGVRPPVTVPSGPGRPRPAAPKPSPQAGKPDVGLDADVSVVPETVGTVRRVLPDPVRRVVPTVRSVTPTRPVTVSPRPVVSPRGSCRLVRVRAGGLLRVCL